MSSVRIQAENDAAALVARLQAGDEAAMADLYDRYSPIVYSVALRVLGDTGAAEDVMQEIFLQLWRHPHSFDNNRGSLAAWLAVIARHRAIDFLRKRRPETDIDTIVVASQADLESAATHAIFIERVRSALGKIPSEQRSCMEMAFFEGLTHAEIAQKTGDPLGTVKTRIRTALITLRKEFGTSLS